MVGFEKQLWGSEAKRSNAFPRSQQISPHEPPKNNTGHVKWGLACWAHCPVEPRYPLAAMTHHVRHGSVQNVWCALVSLSASTRINWPCLNYWSQWKKVLLMGAKAWRSQRAPPDFHALVRGFPMVPRHSPVYTASPAASQQSKQLQRLGEHHHERPLTLQEQLPQLFLGAMWLSMSAHPHKFKGDCLL